VIQPPTSEHSKHPAASESADRSGCGLTIYSQSPSEVVERRSGRPVALCVSIENEPHDKLGPIQLGHAGIDEGVERFDPKPRLTLRCLPPGDRWSLAFTSRVYLGHREPVGFVSERAERRPALATHHPSGLPGSEWRSRALMMVIVGRLRSAKIRQVPAARICWSATFSVS
jgi:hypothetical protein